VNVRAHGKENTMLRNLISPRVCGTLIAVLFAFAANVRADESYYMIVFGQQDRGNRVESSHSFATFHKVTGEGEDRTRHKIETHTISWMPKSLRIRLWGPPEEGVNLDLNDSLKHAKAMGTEVTMWGPFQIKKELYDMAIRQEERLRTGDIAYKVIDMRFRPERATNCIHAISDIDTENGLLPTGTARGNDASFLVLRHLSPWIINHGDDNQWLAKRLELGDEVQRREVQFVDVAR
jgi:hypothetical protein